LFFNRLRQRAHLVHPFVSAERLRTVRDTDQPRTTGGVAKNVHAPERIGLLLAVSVSSGDSGLHLPGSHISLSHMAYLCAWPIAWIAPTQNLLTTTKCPPL